MAAGQLEQRAAPVERPAEVGDDDDERALSRERARPARSVTERRRADPPSTVFVVVLGAERGEKADQPDPALSGRERLRVPVAEGDDAEPVAAAARDVADRERDALGHVGLAAVGRAEGHRRRRVEHEPGDEHALGELDADVRLAGAGGDVPLDLAHVVPGDVGAHLRELGALPEDRRAVVACEHALDPPADADVERPQEQLGHRPRAGRIGPRRPRQRVGRAHAALVRARSTWGTGTAASTASRIRSASVSSASAWYVSTRRWRKASRASAWMSSTTT